MAYELVKSVEKALTVLELLGDHSRESEDLTLTEICQKSGISAAAARNLLRTLETRGYAKRTRHGHYSEGEKCRSLFFSGGVLHRLRRVAEPMLLRKVDELGESLLLVTAVNGRRFEVLRCQAPDDPLESPQWQANELCYEMRTTRVMLAWFPCEKLDYFLKVNGLPNENSWPEASSRAELDEALRTIRLRGGCAEQHANWAAIAVPVFAPDGEIVASLGCYAPLSRTDKARAAGLFKLLGDAASEIAGMLQV